MTTSTRNPAQPVVQKYGAMDSTEFSRNIDQTFQGLERVKNVLTESVESNEIDPLQAVAILACASGQLFGYQAFHGQPSLADLWTTPAGNGQTR